MSGSSSSDDQWHIVGLMPGIELDQCTASVDENGYEVYNNPLRYCLGREAIIRHDDPWIAGDDSPWQKMISRYTDGRGNQIFPSLIVSKDEWNETHLERIADLRNLFQLDVTARDAMHRIDPRHLVTIRSGQHYETLDGSDFFIEPFAPSKDGEYKLHQGAGTVADLPEDFFGRLFPGSGGTVIYKPMIYDSCGKTIHNEGWIETLQIEDRSFVRA